MASDRADLVVVGAGTVGGSASYFASTQGAGRVVVVERGRAGVAVRFHDQSGGAVELFVRD